jgi:hypothetical protein
MPGLATTDDRTFVGALAFTIVAAIRALIVDSRAGVS